MGDWLGDVWLRHGLDPVPVLRRSIARRSKYFKGAVYHLGELGRAAAPGVAELIGVLVDRGIDRGLEPHASIRAMAAQALGKIGRKASAALDRLLELKVDKNPYLRLEAALALSKIAGHPDAIQIMIDALNDSDHFVRSEAARKLQEIADGSEAAIAAIKVAMRDMDAHVRIAAAHALWIIRREPAALACLREISQNTGDQKVRTLAQRLLRGIKAVEAAKERDAKESL